jgi:hypothetical protein
MAVMAFQARDRVPLPKEHPDDDGQMTLMVRLPVLARWSAARRWAAIRRLVTGKLDKASIGYIIVQVETGGLIYLPREPASATPGSEKAYCPALRGADRFR